MAFGKSIRIFLPDSTVTGLRFAEVVNWTGYAVACPRPRLPSLLKSGEIAKPGIYFLFESKYNELKPAAYIGESENVSERLATHDKNKDFWNEVVVFTSKDENLTKSHIKYLESILYGAAKDAKRYDLQNEKKPTASTLPLADQSAMAEFAENIRLVLGVLGYSILEPLIHDEVEKQNGEANSNNAGMAVVAGVPETISFDFFFSINGASAKGRMTDEGFVVKKGSTLLSKDSPSIPGKVASMKQDLIHSGTLKQQGKFLLATEDVLVSSSSYAASLVAGTARSGPQSWKTDDGKPLGDIENRLIEAAGDSGVTVAEPSANLSKPRDQSEPIPGFLAQLTKASDDTPYLGSVKVVDCLVRNFVGSILMRQGAVEEGRMAKEQATTRDAVRCKELAAIFSGNDKNYIPISDPGQSGWNTDGIKDYVIRIMGQHLSENAQTLSTENVLIQVFTALVIEVYNALSDYIETNDEEEMKDRVDALIQDWTYLLLGIPSDLET